MFFTVDQTVYKKPSLDDKMFNGSDMFTYLLGYNLLNLC